MSFAWASPADWRDWFHHAGRGNPWFYERPDQDVQIGPIISPLRFDIVIRAAFFRYYEERRELFRTDFGAFADLAREHEYFVWFEQIMCPRWQPQVLANEDLFSSAWSDRLRATADLYESFDRHGFDTRFPITLYAGREVTETATGKRVSRHYYAGDGNHRIALLLAADRMILSPAEYRVKRFRRLEPSDTTPGLLDLLDVPRERHQRFLRLGDPSPSFLRGAE